MKDSPSHARAVATNFGDRTHDIVMDLNEPKTPEADPIYERGYHAVHHRDLIGEGDYYRARAEAALGYWSPDERNLRVFDYGCGVGQSIALLPNAEGWDVSSEARDVCRAHGLKVYDALPSVPRGVYDRVLCRHVLEHLEQPLETLRLIRDLLVHDGQLVLILPKEEHWIPTTIEADINQHLFCWTPRTIHNLLIRAGFQPMTVRYEYPFGQHALLPLRRAIGRPLYDWAIRVGSRIFRRNGEMVIRAKPANRD